MLGLAKQEMFCRFEIEQVCLALLSCPSHLTNNYVLFDTAGVLVVNVTWRNRTYVGTLLDATKHDWAPPRYVLLCL